jgi:multidrug efflux pump subunit AcrB
VREFQVRLEPERLTARHVSAADVVDAIRKSDVLSSAGLVEANHELYLTLVTGKPSSLAELARIPVAKTGGPPTTLADLGTVEAADAPSFVRTTAERLPAVLINVVRQPDASTLEIARGHRDAVPRAARAPAVRA